MPAGKLVCVPDRSSELHPPHNLPTPGMGEPPAAQQTAAENNESHEDPPQPTAETGVEDDMSTMALTPRLFEHADRPSGPRYTPATVPAASHADGKETDDAAVMLRLRDGDMASFDYLLAKYRKPIVHFMYRMVHNQAVAEELAQEVFLRVYRSRETYRAEARFSTWLYRIATNLGVNYARDNRHERNASTIYLDEVDAETGTTVDVADSTPGAESGMLRQERMNAIREHVMALPERQRMAVVMHKYQNMDYKQIGAVLKLSESATKSLLFRAYQTLRGRLQEFL
jgi:RNA polymerase sigma-70 factor (ECF subfamily)